MGVSVDIHRAYSLLELKAVDDGDQRIITGIATSPEPDRVGDIVEPKGATFKLPIPLCWHHNSREPIGEVFAAKVTSAGIEIKARIAKVDEPGTLKDRLDEAWQSIKHKLVRGLSVGFKPLESVRIEGTYSFKYTSWLWLELSAVTIPANQDATILAIKAIDLAQLAASGFAAAKESTHKSGVSDVPPVVKATKDARTMKRTITEQLAAYEATRVAKTARMVEIMEGSGEEEVTLSPEQKEEYDGLARDVKECDEHLVRLREAEQIQKSTLKPVAGGSSDEGSRARGSQVVSITKNGLPPGIEFTRYVMCLATTQGDPARALEVAKKRFPEQTGIHTVLKEAVSAGTTTDPDWAGALVDYRNFAGDFIEFLRPQTIIGKFGQNGVPALHSVPFNVRILGGSSGGEGYWVGEGQPKPLTKFDFTAITMRWAKVANIAVLSNELIRFSSPSAEANVRRELARALIARLDADFVNPSKAAVADVSPASITNGITGIGSTGNTAADVRADITALMTEFIDANLTPETGVFIMRPVIALGLSQMRNGLGQKEFPEITMRGGTLEGMPVIVSQHVPSGVVVLVNAQDIYLADDGQVVVDASREASLQMSTTPTNSSAAVGSPPAPVEAELVSMFQTNSTAIRAERVINWRRRRDEAVAYLTGVAWGAAA